MYATYLASTSLLIWKALESYGYDSRSLFERVGLDPEKMRDPNARYPDSAGLRLWNLALKTTNDPCFGLVVARYWHPSSLHALGFSWMASESLKDGLERLVRYIRMITDVEQLRLEESDQDYQLKIISPENYPRAPDESFDTFMAVVVDMCRTSYGQDFNPLKVTMKRHAPACSGEFFRVFRSPIEFSAAEDIIFFDKGEINTALPTANAEMARASDQIITEYLAHLDRSQIAIQVKAKMIEQLPSGHMTEETIARAIYLSSRSLQRKLKEEGTTYKDLLDETRRDLASQYIKNSRLSINEITYLLGFSEPSNFSRAFKRWMGVSPSEYRLST